MGQIFEGLAWTSYAQFYLLSGDAEPVMPGDAFVGKENGLCGGSVDGTALLITGTHTGLIPIGVQILDTPPTPGDWGGKLSRSASNH